MSYTPPPFNAVNFDGSGAAYTPPLFSAVNFDDVTTSGYGVDIALRAMNEDTAFDFDLVQGTTVLDSWTESVTVAEGDVIRTHNFSGAVVVTISDRSDLRIRGSARAP